ncbi:MAG: hypothetical protein ACOCUE_04870, partial [Candidatus Izemoplasmataceae bacterium]
MNNFYAKVDTINETSYDTNTLSVLDESGNRLTLRIDENEPLKIGEVYYFETEPIVFKERDQLLVKKYKALTDMQLPLNELSVIMRNFYQYAPVDMENVKKGI